MISLGLGLGIGMGGGSDGSIDPRTVSQLKAGAIYLAGEGVTSLGSGNSSWASLATQANPAIDTNAAHKPLAVIASNGVAAWDLAAPGSTACWAVMAPGTALQWTKRGSFCIWAKGILTASQVYLFSHGPEGYGGPLGSDNRSINNRMTFWSNALGSIADAAHTKFSSTVSFYGSSADTQNYLHDGRDLPGRAKHNCTVGLIDPRDWHFYRLAYDSLKLNYTGTGSLIGADLSHRWELYVDEILDEGTGFSAPTNDAIYTHPGTPPDPTNGINYKVAPDGPVRLFDPYNGLAPSSSPWVIGAANYAGGAHWPGLISHVMVANEEDVNGGAISPEQWRRIMNFRRPA